MSQSIDIVEYACEASTSSCSKPTLDSGVCQLVSGIKSFRTLLATSYSSRLTHPSAYLMPRRANTYPGIKRFEVADTSAEPTDVGRRCMGAIQSQEGLRVLEVLRY